MWRQELQKAAKGDLEGMMAAARLMVKPKEGPRLVLQEDEAGFVRMVGCVGCVRRRRRLTCCISS